MKKILGILLVLVLVFSALGGVFTSPVLAGPSEGKGPPQEVLDANEARLNAHTITKALREVPINELRGKPGFPPGLLKKVEEGEVKIVEYEAEISSLPQTQDDLKTLIVCDWQEGIAVDGVTFYDAKNNLYQARVTGTRVSVEYKGLLAVWDPDIFVGGHSLELISGPGVVSDPINPNYPANTIKWVYNWSTEGILGIGIKSVTITRYLRQIEGRLFEYFVLDENPEADIQIRSNYQCEQGFRWTTEVFAYDANYKPLLVTGSSTSKTVSRWELNRQDITYPVTIDPTISPETESGDGEISENGPNYNTIRTSSTGLIRQSNVGCIGQYYGGAGYDYIVYRYMASFDTDLGTSGATAIVDSGYLKIYGYSDWSDTNFDITIQSGMPTYPHLPPITGDYYYANYSGDGGSKSTSGFSGSSYNTIYLNSTGESWINLEGYTKFMLRSSRDISSSAPTGSEGVTIRESSYGSGYAPKLYVTYYVPITIPVAESYQSYLIEETEARLKGYLDDDGGVGCSTSLRYGLSDTYSDYVTPSGTYYSGDYFSSDVYGLEKGTLYHWTAEALNTAGSSPKDDKTFLTKPGGPTELTVTPGDGQNQLDWTEGIGTAIKTLVRFKTTGYPSSTTDGTQIYFDDAETYTHTPITNGTTYYYRLWAYAASGALTRYSDEYTSGSGTPVTVGASFVTTNAANPVGTTTATLRGTLDSLGGEASSDCYFQYYWITDWNDHSTIGDKDVLTAPGLFDVGITSLPTDTLIHVRAVSDNNNVADPTYGEDEPFTTGAASAPTMETTNYGGVTKTEAFLYGKVVNDGDTNDTLAKFYWGETTEYGRETDTTPDFLQTGDTYVAHLVDLTPGTTYHFQAVGWNSVDYGFGEDKSFQTASPVAPTVTTNTASDEGATEALLHGTLNTDGGVPCEVQFQYSATGVYEGEEEDTGWMANYQSGDPFEFLVTGLDTGEDYYYRAQAKNSHSTVSGESLSFTTIFSAPGNFRATPLSGNSISLTWIRSGDKTAVYAKAGAFPTDRLDGDQIYIGPDEGTLDTNLLPGRTYFYRAWSWKEGEAWSTAYAEDAATTLAGTLPGVPDTPDVDTSPPEALPEGFIEPSGEALVNLPTLPPLIESGAAALGMNSGAMWLAIIVLMSTLVSLVVAGMTGQPWIVFLALLGGLVLGTAMGIVALWIVVLFFVLGGFGIYFLPKGAA